MSGIRPDWIWSSPSTSTTTGNFIYPPISISTDISIWPTLVRKGTESILLLYKQIAEEARDRAEKILEKSPHFDTFEGFSAIANGILFAGLKQCINSNNVEHTAKLCFSDEVRNAGPHPDGHVFVEITGDMVRYIVDVAADAFGQSKVIFLDVRKDGLDPSETWWSSTKRYKTKEGLSNYLQKLGWHKYQLLLNHAKKVKPSLKTIQSIDDEAISVLAKGEDLETNLAKLLLDSDPNVKNAAKKIAAILANR